MLFVDHTVITVYAGDGGNGCEAYAQPPYTRSPYPDGGNGGNGGSVILRADHNVATLLDFQFRHTFRAKKGAHGSGNNRTGRSGEDVVIPTPPGTLIRDKETGAVLRDLRNEGEEVVVARGGRGGLGNANAGESRDGEPGEVRTLLLELKLIADVGLIGFPNAGKSSLLSRLSTARPKVGAYPFTTRQPMLGVVRVNEDETFVACDIPGLIEGAHEGRGMGIEFLRHIERTRLLIHLIDAAATEGRDPVEAHRQINAELRAYSPELSRKPQLVAANKMDLPDAAAGLKRLRDAVKQPVYPVSCATGQGIPELLRAAAEALRGLKGEE